MAPIDLPKHLTNGFHHSDDEDLFDLSLSSGTPPQMEIIGDHFIEEERVPERPIAQVRPERREQPVRYIAPQIPFQHRQDSRQQSRVLGNVKWFNAKNGYGFATRHDTGEDVFVHYTAISKKNPRHSIRSLGDGEIVEFNVMAVNVTGPQGRHVRGNPYVSHIPIPTLPNRIESGPDRHMESIPTQRYDFFAAGDSSLIVPDFVRHVSRPASNNLPNSRIPRWTAPVLNTNPFSRQPLFPYPPPSMW